MDNLKSIVFIFYSLLTFAVYGQIGDTNKFEIKFIEPLQYRPELNIRGNSLKRINAHINFDSLNNAKETRAMPDYDSTCHVRILIRFRVLMATVLETTKLEKLIPFIRYNTTSITTLKSHKKIEIYDKRTQYIDHSYFAVIALLDDSCNVLIPKSVNEINGLVLKEPELTIVDIAFLYMFFNKKGYNKLFFPSNRTYNTFTKKSSVFNIMYSILDYDITSNTRGINKNCKKLFISNDSMVQFVTRLSRDEYRIVDKSKDYSIMKLITLHFNSDRTISHITKSYFRPDDKYKKNTYYKSLDNILNNRLNR